MIYRSVEDVKEMFRYHPVDNPERAMAHDALNLAAQNFAVELFNAIQDAIVVEELMNEVQFMRMLGNQYITYYDIQKKKKKESFETTMKRLTGYVNDESIEE